MLELVIINLKNKSDFVEGRRLEKLTNISR
jgi:hypothetical protein